jgi:signal transduction histidine kinase
MLIANGAVLVGVLVLVGACMWGLRMQRQHVDASLQEYTAIKSVKAAQLSVIAARAGLQARPPDNARVIGDLQDALQSLRGYNSTLTSYAPEIPADVGQAPVQLARDETVAAVAHVNNLLDILSVHNQAAAGAGVSHASIAGSPPADPQAIAVAAVDDLADLLDTCNAFVEHTQGAADRDLTFAKTIVAYGAALIALLMLMATLWQYQRVMVPLQRLRAWSRRVAGGDLSAPYQASSDREFAELGADINSMAVELQGFYRDLEEMVAAKSKELARSERLASVGYLAAGVAHEINNPLSIMSGHAELSTRRLQAIAGDGKAAEIFASLRIIREEAVRCKQITQKLLLLARGGSAAGREIVELWPLISEIVQMVQGLQCAQGRRIEVKSDDSIPVNVMANAAELKQVLLNLLVNALESTAAAGGLVEIDAKANGQWVGLTVSDNGRGMSGKTIERIFEPFYSEKRGSPEPGTGLGLSITHAIVSDLGGALRAESDGPGRGSRFILRLPAALRRKSAVNRIGQFLGSDG